MSHEACNKRTFSDDDIQELRAELKIGILGTVNEQGLPHLTMISSLMAHSPTEVVWGQFTEGTSKTFIRQNPKVGFLIMSLAREYWRGKATFTHIEQSGEAYERYNNQPMFRYNAYFGVHSVYFMDLIGHSGRKSLPMGAVVGASVQTLLGRSLALRRSRVQVLNSWTRALFNKLDNLKFLSYVGEDGYPIIFPVIQAQALDGEQMIFSTSAFRDELSAIPPGTTCALFGLTLDMEDVLLRGCYEGVRRVGGMRCGVLRVDWVYNSMPPVPGQIYPPVELKAVEFS